MNAIFAYKILDDFWKPKDEYFWDVARLAVNNASSFYSTCLYADTRTYDIFSKNGLKFDKFVDCTELFDSITEHTYGLAKVFTMIEQKEPYIILDLDTVLFSKIDSNSQVTYGHKEINVSTSKPIQDKITDLNYLQTYYNDSFNKVKGKLNLDIKSYDWITFPSNCLMVVNAPGIVSELYKLILENLREYIFQTPPPLTVQFYEQFLLYNLLLKYSIEVDFVYKNPPGQKFEDTTSLVEIYTHKYLHFDRYQEPLVKKIIKKLC